MGKYLGQKAAESRGRDLPGTPHQRPRPPARPREWFPCGLPSLRRNGAQGGAPESRLGPSDWPTHVLPAVGYGRSRIPVLVRVPNTRNNTPTQHNNNRTRSRELFLLFALALLPVWAHTRPAFHLLGFHLHRHRHSSVVVVVAIAASSPCPALAVGAAAPPKSAHSDMQGGGIDWQGNVRGIKELRRGE